MREATRSQAKCAAGEPLRRVQTGLWCVELLPRAPYHAAYTPDLSIIGFAFDSQVGVHAFASDRKTGFRAKPNGLAYVPAGCDVYSQSNTGGEYLRIIRAGARCKKLTDERRFSDVTDMSAIDAAHGLRRELLACGEDDLLACERFVMVLQSRVWAVFSGTCRARRASGWMTTQRLRRIDEIIEAQLDAKLTVHELASAVGLSAGFFSRAFKAAVGMSPHDYIIDRRISRARELLEKSGQDLSAIAYASGFASHSHMTTQFSERLGISPSKLRMTT